MRKSTGESGKRGLVVGGKDQLREGLAGAEADVTVRIHLGYNCRFIHLSRDRANDSRELWVLNLFIW